MRSTQGPTAYALGLVLALMPAIGFGPISSGLALSESDVVAAFPTWLTKRLESVRSHAQEAPNTCGPSTVSALLSGYMGDKVTEAQVRKGMGFDSKQACSLEDVAKYLASRGYKVEAGKTRLTKALQSIARNQTPMIVQMNRSGGHAALLLGKDAKGVVLWDPAMGKCESKPLKVFEKEWSGFGLNAQKSK